MKYKNLDGITNNKSVRDFYRWQSERKQKKKDYSFQVPQYPQKKANYLQENKQDTTITWIGHSTFLIQLEGLTILTDPVWASRMGFQKRLTQPGLELHQLPSIDIVLISHGHYDHLDFNTLKHLPKECTYLIPFGLKKLFEKRGIHNTIECNWWEELTYGDLHFAFVPAQHWTRRGLLDANRSHWGGWIIQGNETIYFGGDSGYFSGFKNIGNRYSVDIALLPIGAYEPEWFMKESHMTPEEAVTAFLDVKASYFIPMHYGTFSLADDTPKEALSRLQASWIKNKLPKNKLKALLLGETFILNNTHS